MIMSPLVTFIFLAFLGIFFWNLTGFVYNYISKNFFSPKEIKIPTKEEKQEIYTSKFSNAGKYGYITETTYIRGGKGNPRLLMFQNSYPNEEQGNEGDLWIKNK